MEQLKTQHPWLTEAELAVFADLPKKEDGKTYDLEAMDAEQRSVFYKDRAEASTAGFHKFKSEADVKLAELDELKKNPKPKEEEKNKALTEEQLEDVVPGYAGLSDREKDLVKSTIAPFAKNVTALQGQVAKLLDQERFKEEVTELLADPKYKVLIKHKEAFKKYAYTDENLNTPLKTLANSYIYENELKEEDDLTPEERKGLEDGTGGERLPPKKGMTTAEVTKLRVTDPRRYARLAKDRKLKKTTGLE